MSAFRSTRTILAHPDAMMNRKPGVRIDRIVLHVMEGTQSGTIDWFRKGRDVRAVPTAAHYLISRMGDVCQMVPDHLKCYHANSFNSRSLGIEHEGWTDGLWRVGKKPWAILDSIFPTEMLAASAEIVRILCVKFDIPMNRHHIIGHYEVPGATHTDPGPLWSWSDYMALVTDGGAVAPGAVAR